MYVILSQIIQIFLMLVICRVMYLTMKRFQIKKPNVARQIWTPLTIYCVIGFIWPLGKYFIMNTSMGHAMLYASPGARLLHSIAIFNLIAPLLLLIAFIYYGFIVLRYVNQDISQS